MKLHSGRHLGRTALCYLHGYLLTSGLIWIKVGLICRLTKKAEHLVNLNVSDVQRRSDRPAARHGEPPAEERLGLVYRLLNQVL